MQLDKDLQSQISEFPEDPSILRKSIARPVHKRSMSEEAIKRSYFKEDDEEEKPKPALEFMKSETSIPHNKSTQEIMPQENMMEEEIIQEELPTMFTIQHQECMLIFEIAKKIVSSKQEEKKEKEKTINKTSAKTPQPKKVNTSVTPTSKKSEEPIQKPKINEKVVATKEKTAESEKQNKPKNSSKTIKKGEEKPKATAQIQNEIKPKLDKSKVKIENQDTIQTAELLATTKQTKKPSVATNEKSDVPAKPEIQTKLLASKVQSNLSL